MLTRDRALHLYCPVHHFVHTVHHRLCLRLVLWVVKDCLMKVTVSDVANYAAEYTKLTGILFGKIFVTR